MSLERNHTFDCPNCKRKNLTVFWESLNSTIDPEVNKQLLDGTLFKYTCPHCNNTYMLTYPMLYHQMELKKMVWLVDPAEVEKIMAEWDKGRKEYNELDEAKYTYRIVTDQNDLREKALIFNDGYDDTTMEIAKMLLVILSNNQKQDIDIKHVYYGRTDGEELVFELIKSDGSVCASVSKEVYRTSIQFLKEHATEKDLNSYIVNERWAADILERVKG